jgi:hypothetical protein
MTRRSPRERALRFRGPHADELVRGLIAGTVTQIREPVLPWTRKGGETWVADWQDRAFADSGYLSEGEQYVRAPFAWADPADGEGVDRIFAPWSVGERRWLQEAHRRRDTGKPAADRPKAGASVPWEHFEREIVYRADGSVRRQVVTLDDWRVGDEPCRECACTYWLPAGRMPRLASRWIGEVVSVRAQRLGDATEGDAVAEGCSARTWMYETEFGTEYEGEPAGADLVDRWDHTFPACPAAGNPWTFVATLRRVED